MDKGTAEMAMESQEAAERRKLIAEGRLWESITMDKLRADLKEIDWLWPKWIPKAFITGIIAPSDAGKSLLGLSLAKIVLGGSSWPDGKLSNLGGGQKVIWVEAEAGQEVLSERMEKSKIDPERLILPVIQGDKFGQPDLARRYHQEGLWRMVEREKPAMVVIDSLGQAQTRSENQVQEVRGLMTFLQHLARDHRAVVLLIHHFNKPGQLEVAPIWRARGSTLIAAACKSIISIEPPVGSATTRKVYHVKSNLAAKEPPFAMIIGAPGNFVEFGPWMEESAEQETDMERCINWLQDCLKENGPQCPRDLVQWAKENEGFSQATVYRAKAKAANIISKGKGRNCVWTLSSQEPA